MSKDLAKRTGFEVEGREKKLYISNQELVSHGCKNCIWRLHNQCTHSIVKDNEFYDFEHEGKNHSGYCMEYVNFLLGFAATDDSISAVWEKFSLYVSRIQSLEDYTAYMKLCEEIKIKEAEGDTDPKELNKLKGEKEMLRLWWERLNFTLQKGYSKIADRETKSRDASKSSGMSPIMGTKTVNFIVEKK